MPKYKCLECGRDLNVEEGNPGYLVKCGHCKSYWCWPIEKYEAIINGLMNVVHDNTPVLDIVRGVVGVLFANGVSGRPKKTLEIAVKLVEEAERRKKTAKRGEL
ncbi:MAG: hypothetical protein QW660_07960 [Candidatus Bathyarchaeia archaeon]